MGKLGKFICISALVAGVCLPVNFFRGHCPNSEIVNLTKGSTSFDSKRYLADMAIGVNVNRWDVANNAGVVNSLFDGKKYLVDVTTGVNVNKWEVVSSDIRYSGQN